MTDRDGLLRAIRRAPEDHTRRLAYADLLDENPHWPGAQAQAELLRLFFASRNVNRRKYLDETGMAWLVENWPRLIPSVVAKSVPFTPDEHDMARPDGLVGRADKDEIDLLVRLPGRLCRGGIKLYPCRLVLSILFGLVWDFKMPSEWGFGQIEGALLADLPQLGDKYSDRTTVEEMTDADAEEPSPVRDDAEPFMGFTPEGT